MRTVRAAFAAALSLSILAACATTPPPPPPPVEYAPVLNDWRRFVTVADRDRYERIDAAWTLALEQARRQQGSGDLRGTGELIDPDAARPGATPPVGDYRCRTVKLGSQGGDEGLGYVVYGWFRCRVEDTPQGLRFSKLTGSQRPAGLIFPETDRRMILLGFMALASEPTADSYGRRPDRDVIAVVERIGEARWRLVIPWPQAESNLDLIELVPAA